MKKFCFLGLVAALLVGAAGCKTDAGSETTASISSVSIEGPSSVSIGETIQLTAIVLPNIPENSKLPRKWEVINNTGKIISVNNSGVVTGLSAGTGKVRVTVAGKTSTKQITVGVASSIQGFDLNNKHYSYVWGDEFDGSSPIPDTTKWKYQVGTGDWGWGNGEKQYYKDNTNEATTAVVSDGTLKIKAYKENGTNWVSARMNSKTELKYGYIEAKMKITDVPGAWPAYWMMPNESAKYNYQGGEYGIWPKSGEIDMMECAPSTWGAHRIFSTLHAQNHNGGNGWSIGDATFENDLASEWHTVAIEWTENSITAYYDGVKKNSRTRSASMTSDDWPYDKNFYIILNLAIGGMLGGDADADKLNSAEFEIDYIRWYQIDENYTPPATVAVTGITVSGDSTVTVGNNATYTASVTPSNATNKEVTWSVSPTTYATINASTGVLTPKAAGTVTVTATAKDGSGKKGTKSVTVKAAAVAPSSVPSTITLNSKTYNYVWSDEFDYTGLPSSSKWGYDVGNGLQNNSDGTNPGNADWGNGELQWYSNADTDNTYVSDGSLKINAIRENSNGKTWTSGRIVTRNISGAQFKYGYVEMRAKIPYDAGVWPAFWMLDNDIYAGQGWPRSGEIDIMETSVNLWGNKVYGTLHCEAGHSGNPIITKSFDNNYTAFSDGQYHTYAVDWDDDHIDWYYDGVKQFTYTPSSYAKEPWPFNEEFYIIINLAVGGNLGRDVPDSLNKSTMEIDYVRVYQKASYTDHTSGVPTVSDTAAPSTVLAKTIPAGSKVIYDSTATVTNAYTSIENWNGTLSAVDCTLNDGKTVKRIEFSGTNNICGGMKGLSVPTSANDKLYISVYASQNFKIQVNDIGWIEYTVPKAGTYSWVNVERSDLGSATVNQIGFLSDVNQKIFVDHIYISGSGTTGGSEGGEGGSTGGTGGSSGATYTVNLNTAVNGAWMYIDVLSSDTSAVNNLIVDSSKISNVDMTPASSGAVGAPSKIDGGVRYGWGFANAEFHAGTHTLKFTLATSDGSYDFVVTFTGTTGQNVDMTITSQSCTKK